jgi:hypothetical protein
MVCRSVRFEGVAAYGRCGRRTDGRLAEIGIAGGLMPTRHRKILMRRVGLVPPAGLEPA